MSFELEVVIAAYNNAPYLADTLDSVLAQDLSVGIWVVDDGSTDATCEVVSRYLDTGRVFYCRQDNSGRPAVPRNVGFQHVTAPYVVFFDGDDVMMPRHLRTQRDLLRTHPTWNAITCDYQNFSADEPATGSQFSQCPRLAQSIQNRPQEFIEQRQVIELSTHESRTILAEENFFINGSAVYRTEVIRHLGGFDERLQASEDFDLFWRVAGQGTIGVSTFLAFRRRLHATNISNDYARVLEAKRASRDRLSQNETDPKVRRILDETVARTLADLATFHMPLDPRLGTRFLFSAARRSLPLGIVPVEAAKALIKSLIRRCLNLNFS